MSTRRISLTLTTTVALAGALAMGSAAAPAPSGSAAGTTEKITPKGAGQVRLGKTHGQLRRAGLVGKLRRGCELGGPDTRSARLRAPLRGFVTYTLDAPRRVTDISVTGGATARGVGIGATIPDIRDAFPKAKVIRATEETFGITLVRIPKNGGGKLNFAVDVDTKKTTTIGIPRIAFCE